MREPNDRLLLIDTCGATAGVALACGAAVVAACDLDAGKASAEVVGAIRQLLNQVSWSLTDLAAVGVVSGPGSFTGMRTGLAAGKGLCEGAGIPLVTVSRLAVLAHAARTGSALCALDAGSSELYLRDVLSGGEAREFLCAIDQLTGVLDVRQLVVAEAKLSTKLAAIVPAERLILQPICAADALPLMLQSLGSSSDLSALAEANYVREEQHIYPRVAK